MATLLGVDHALHRRARIAVQPGLPCSSRGQSRALDSSCRQLGLQRHAGVRLRLPAKTSSLLPGFATGDCGYRQSMLSNRAQQHGTRLEPLHGGIASAWRLLALPTRPSEQPSTEDVFLHVVRSRNASMTGLPPALQRESSCAFGRDQPADHPAPVVTALPLPADFFHVTGQPAASLRSGSLHLVHCFRGW